MSFELGLDDLLAAIGIVCVCVSVYLLGWPVIVLLAGCLLVARGVVHGGRKE